MRRVMRGNMTSLTGAAAFAIGLTATILATANLLTAQALIGAVMGVPLAGFGIARIASQKAWYCFDCHVCRPHSVRQTCGPNPARTT